MAVSGADRARLRRARAQRGLIVVPCELDSFAFTEFLIQKGLLKAAEIEDRRRVGEALSQWLHRFVTRDS